MVDLARMNEETARIGRKVLTSANPDASWRYARQLFAVFIEWATTSADDIGVYAEQAAPAYWDLTNEEQKKALAVFGLLLGKMLDECKDSENRYGILAGAVAFAVYLGDAHD